MFKFLLLTVLVISSVVKADDPPVPTPKSDVHTLLGIFTITVTDTDKTHCVPTGTANFETSDPANPTFTIPKWSAACDFITEGVVFKPIVESTKTDLIFENLLPTISYTSTGHTITVAKETSNYTNTNGTVDAKWTAKFTITKDDDQTTYNYDVTFEYKGDLICLKNEFLDADKHNCIPCPDTCVDCKSATECTTCKAGFGIEETDKVCHKCVGATFLDGQTCTKCHDTCGTCANANECLKCVDKYGFNPKTKLCEACQPDEWSVDNLNCKKCPQDCTTCDSDQKCTDCVEGKYLPQQGGLCKVCEAGEWTDKENKLCVLCPTNCKTCESNTACNTCKERSGLVDGKGLCLDCTNHQYSKDNACHECAPREILEVNTCKACAANEVVNGTACVACATNQWADVNTCKNCPEGCTTCTNADTCTACAENLVLNKENKCVSKGLSGVVIALIVILIIAVIGGVAFFLYKRKQGEGLRDEMDYKSVVA